MELELARWCAEVMRRGLEAGDAGKLANVTDTREHEVLLSALADNRIAVTAPVVDIIKAIRESPNLRGTPLEIKIQEEWKQYQRIIFKANNAAIAQCERESEGWFEREMSHMTLRDLWQNPFWLTYERDQREMKRDFPVLGFVRTRAVRPMAAPRVEKKTLQRTMRECEDFAYTTFQKAKASYLLRLLQPVKGGALNPGVLLREAGALETTLKDLFHEVQKDNRVHSAKYKVPYGARPLPLSVLMKLRGSGVQPSTRLMQEYETFMEDYGENYGWETKTYAILDTVSNYIQQKAVVHMQEKEEDIKEVTQNPKYVELMQRFVSVNLAGLARDVARSTASRLGVQYAMMASTLQKCYMAMAHTEKSKMERMAELNYRRKQVDDALRALGSIELKDVMSQEEEKELARLHDDHLSAAISADMSLQTYVIGDALRSLHNRDAVDAEGNSSIERECAEKIKNLFSVVTSFTPNEKTAPHTTEAVDFELTICKEAAMATSQKMMATVGHHLRRVGDHIHWATSVLSEAEKDAMRILGTKLHVDARWSSTYLTCEDIVHLHAILGKYQACVPKMLHHRADTVLTVESSLLKAMHVLAIIVEYKEENAVL